MVLNTSQHPHPLPATHCLYILYFDFGKGGGVGGGKVNQREGYMGNSSQSWVENNYMTDCITNRLTLLKTSKDDIVLVSS